jgi:phosphonate transport system ATP-binding protein
MHVSAFPASVTDSASDTLTDPMLSSLDGVRVSYAGGVAALDEVSLLFARGEQVAIIGPSGAGKTTLLHTLGCAIRPTAGRVRVLGREPWAMPYKALHRLRSELFIAPQSPPLPPRQRVVNAVLAGRVPQWTTWNALKSLLHPLDAGAAHHALAHFRVEDKLFLRCDRLSGGERQRVGLARLLVSKARLLLLDEPVSALDPALAKSALETLQQEAFARGATLVVGLHAVDLALARFARLIGLRSGRVAFDLPRAKVTDALLAHLYGADLGVAFQEPPSTDDARLRVTRCL